MADYGDLARSILQEKFPLFGSFRTLVTYQRMPTAVYDPDIGVDTGIPEEYSLYVIILNFSFTKNQSSIRKRDDIDVLSKDKRIIFPAADLPVIPQIHDNIIAPDISYRIIGINDDPKPAHFYLHCRPWDEAS